MKNLLVVLLFFSPPLGEVDFEANRIYATNHDVYVVGTDNNPKAVQVKNSIKTELAFSAGMVYSLA